VKQGGSGDVSVGGTQVASAGTDDDEARAGSSLGSVLFDNRRWVHPVVLGAAIVLGGAHPWAVAAGAALILAMLGLRLAVCRHIGGAARVHARKAQQMRVLVTGGPFAWVRNPLYLANSFGLAGGCLLFGPPWWAGVACAASLLWYSVVIRWEEGVLARLYGQEYTHYLARVPRLLPWPPGRPADRPADRAAAYPPGALYPWRRVLRRERGAMIGAAAMITAGVLVSVLLA
jgi:protein-S-isoprenylcysteine O-methyltransferase Ste14